MSDKLPKEIISPVPSYVIKNTLLYVDGSKTSFHCNCGCNVFHPVNDPSRPLIKIYECNACGDWYIGEKDGE